MSLSDSIRDRNIQEVVHFTTHKGLLGTLAKGQLLSRHRLREDEYLHHILHPNARFRPEDAEYFDKSEKWIDYVNLSVSEINRRYFNFSTGWDNNKNVWWAVLAFDPVIMLHPGVYFATTNNGYEHCVRGAGEAGFDALFGSPILRKGDWRVSRGGRASYLPTCEQAEVLYPAGVPLTFLRRIYVRSPEREDEVRAWLRLFKPAGVELVLDPKKFEGVLN